MKDANTPDKTAPPTKVARPESAAIGSAFKEESLGKISDGAVIQRLWGYMRPYRHRFLLSLALMPVVTALSLVQPWLIQRAIDEHLIPGQGEGLGWVLGLFAAAVVGQAAADFACFMLMQGAGQRALKDLRQEIFDHVQSLSVSFFKKNPLGRLMARMTTDVESLQEALSSGIVTMVGDFLTLSAIVVILLSMDWQMTLASFTVVPVLLVVTAWIRTRLRAAFRDIRVKIARLYSHLQESVTGMGIMQLFVRERVSGAEYREINAEHRDANVRSIRYDAMLYAVVEAVGSIAVGAVIWYGSGGVLQEAVTLGMLVAFIEYLQKFFVPIRDLAQKYNLLQGAIASSERVFQLLDTHEHIPACESPVPVPDGPLRVEFQNVSFAYADGEWVVRDLSFVIEPGEKIAVVGHTGAGKSTVLNLLMRLYDVSEGAILVNGTDIRSFDLRAYRERFAIVLQDVFMFHGTIHENLTLGASGISRDDVQRAVATVHAEGVVGGFTQGYEHLIAERGANLSSGQKQLLSFARALLRKPEILILDEATANVDTDTEALLQSAVEELMTRQTSLVIAHRLSTIQRADRILVMHRGQLLESGSHEELLAGGGHYATLYRLQYAPALGAPADVPFEQALAPAHP